MSTNGYLQLGIAISGAVVVTPPASGNYLGQPVSFDSFVGGIQLTSVNCVFGPVSGAWGTLTCFGVTEDQAGTIAVVAPGTLQAPFTPLNGQLVVVPPGDMSLVVGAQYAAGPGAFVVTGAVVATSSGPTTSGYTALSSVAYAPVLASGMRGTLQIQNLSQIDSISLVFGGGLAPVTGAVPTVVLPPFATWPPAGTNFVTTAPVWATSTLVSGTNLSWTIAAPPSGPLQNTGPTTSGFVSLASSGYTAVVASGARNLLQIQNTSQIDSLRLIFGGNSAPSSGAVPSFIVPPYGAWPPPGSNFVTTDAVWATCGLASGTVLSWMTG